MAAYVDLDGIRTWYDERGSGDPVVLLHGGLTDIRDFGGNLGTLSERFHLFLPERRGHGHTPDVDGALTIDAMAADTVAFLRQVVGGPAHLVGYSAGAMVALWIAAEHPELVRRLVVISGAFDPDGMLVKPSADGAPPPPLVDAYAEVSPDGREHFATVVAKVVEAATQPGLDVNTLRAITAPTLVVTADDDFVALEHTVELFAALPDAGLAVTPYASHMLLHEQPAQIASLVGDFLQRDIPTRMAPIKRAPA